MEPDTRSLPSVDDVQAPESTTPRACGARARPEAARLPARECGPAAEAGDCFTMSLITPNGVKATPGPPDVSCLRRAAIIAPWTRTSGA